MEATTDKFRDIAVGMLCCLLIANIVGMDLFLLYTLNTWTSS